MVDLLVKNNSEYVWKQRTLGTSSTSFLFFLLSVSVFLLTGAGFHEKISPLQNILSTKEFLIWIGCFGYLLKLSLGLELASGTHFCIVLQQKSS